MSNHKGKLSIFTTAAAVGVLMSGGVAVAEDTAMTEHDKQAYDAKKSTEMKHHDAVMSENMKRDAHQMTTDFGVEELADIEGWEIVNNSETLGSIDRLGVDRQTGEILAIVGLEGVLGLNMKEVAIPLKQLQKAGDENLSTTMSKEQLQQKRDIDPWTGTFSQLLNDAS